MVHREQMRHPSCRIEPNSPYVFPMAPTIFYILNLRLDIPYRGILQSEVTRACANHEEIH